MQILSSPDVFSIYPQSSNIILHYLLLNSFIVSCCYVDSLSEDDCLKESWNIDENAEDDDGAQEGEYPRSHSRSSIVLLVEIWIAHSSEPDNEKLLRSMRTVCQTSQRQCQWLCRWSSRGRCYWEGRWPWARDRHSQCCPLLLASARLCSRIFGHFV